MSERETINWNCLEEEVEEKALAVSSTKLDQGVVLGGLSQPPVIIDDFIERPTLILGDPSGAVMMTGVQAITEPVEHVNPLDIEQASKLLPWEQIEAFKEQTKDFEVVTFLECETAMSMGMQSRKLYKAVDKKRKEITAPNTLFIKSVKKIADAFIDELKAIEGSMLGQVNKFNKEREEKSKEIGIELQKVEKTDDGTSYDQEYWEFKVLERLEVPLEYLKLDDKKIKDAISDGIRNIPGLCIHKVQKRRFRIT